MLPTGRLMRTSVAEPLAPADRAPYFGALGRRERSEEGVDALGLAFGPRQRGHKLPMGNSF